MIDGEQCDRTVHANGLCNNHYRVEQRRLHPKICSVVIDGESCNRSAARSGLCFSHYNMKREGKPFRVIHLRQQEKTQDGKCFVVVDEIKCERKVAAWGMCEPHYRMDKEGRPLAIVRPTRRMNATLVRNKNGEKQCIRCYLWKDVSCFCTSKNTADGLGVYCNECSTTNRNEYNTLHPEVRRGRHLKNRYNMNIPQWDELFESQGRMCPGCGVDEPDGRGWMTDHDHSCCPGETSCGECVRGILCFSCNVALGLLHDSAQTMSNLIDYLKVGTKNENPVNRY